MATYACPKCNAKLQKIDGKKIGGISGNKYWLCLPCKFVKPVKHRKFNPESRGR